MTYDQAAPALADSVDFSTSAWAGKRSQSWLANASRLEAMLEPVHGPLFSAAALRVGEVVLDVGCGRGATAFEAARRVGAGGRVVGVDVSDELISAARAVTGEPGAVEIEWVTADAQHVNLSSLAADVLISRFGVLFFDDPVEAFANLRRAVRKGGRLSVAVWPPRTASPFQTRSLDVAVATAAENGHELSLPDPDAGPFAFGVERYATDVLVEAGWADVRFATHALWLYAGGPGATPAEATELGLSFGALATLTADLPPAVVAAIRTSVETDLAECWDGIGVGLEAEIAVVTAISPADLPEVRS